MTVKDLKKFMANLPDDMLVGSVGHFGEHLECLDVSISEAEPQNYPRKRGKKFKILNICIQEAGPDPE